MAKFLHRERILFQLAFVFTPLALCKAFGRRLCKSI